jgi:methionyl-tRNA synthetase
VEQVHFIGKDIITFHTLFWPAMLYFSGRKVPNKVFVHGFLDREQRREDEQEPRHRAGPAEVPVARHEPEWLRYYLAAKLNGRNEDIDFNPETSWRGSTADLVGKYVNIASRAVKFVPGGKLVEAALPAFDAAALVETVRRCTKAATTPALREIMAAADQVNTAFDQAAPWKLAKEGKGEARRPSAAIAWKRSRC